MVGPRLSNGRFDLLYGELASGARTVVGRPMLRFRDVAKRNLASLKITDWENVANNRTEWRSIVYKRLLVAEEEEIEKHRERRRKRTSTYFTC